MRQPTFDDIITIGQELVSYGKICYIDLIGELRENFPEWVEIRGKPEPAEESPGDIDHRCPHCQTYNLDEGRVSRCYWCDKQITYDAVDKKWVKADKPTHIPPCKDYNPSSEKCRKCAEVGSWGFLPCFVEEEPKLEVGGNAEVISNSRDLYNISIGAICEVKRIEKNYAIVDFLSERHDVISLSDLKPTDKPITKAKLEPAPENDLSTPPIIIPTEEAFKLLHYRCNRISKRAEDQADIIRKLRADLEKSKKDIINWINVAEHHSKKYKTKRNELEKLKAEQGEWYYIINQSTNERVGFPTNLIIKGEQVAHYLCGTLLAAKEYKIDYEPMKVSEWEAQYGGE